MKTKTHSLLKKSVIFFCIIIVIALFASGISSYFYNVAHIKKNSASQAKAGAAAAAEVIEEEDFNAIQQSATGEPYIKARKILKSICQSFDLEYLYLYVPDAENGSVRYIMTVASDEEKDAVIATERGLNVTVSATISSQEMSAWEGNYDYSIYEENNSYGHVYSWFYAVKNSEGTSVALIGCDYRIDRLTSQVVEETLLILLPMCIALGFIVVLFIIFMNKKVFAPIKLISSRMNSFIDERQKNLQPLAIHSDDEIQGIANSFEKMSNDINTYIETNQKLLTESVQAKVQMDVASRIQCGIVPVELNQKEEGYTLYGFAKPAKEVGGDFYDAFPLANGQVCLFIGDVSGKGIGAALFMVMVKTMLKDGLLSGLSPATALNTVNDTICRSNPEGMFATIFVALYNPANGELTYANAGHTKPVLLGDIPAPLQVESGVAVGLFEDAGITDCTARLCQTGGILLYTDGVTEAIDRNKKFYGETRLLASVKGVQLAKDCVEKLNGSVAAFAGGCEQFDDYTVLALFRQTGGEQKYTFAPVLSELERLRQILFQVANETFDKKKVYLACEEVFVNIVSYAKANQIEVRVKEVGDHLRVTFVDDGLAFNPLQEQPPKKSFDEFQSGGMGLTLIAKLSTPSYTPNPNILTLTFTPKKA